MDSEMRHAEKLHHDTFQEITIVRLLLDGLDTESSVVKGFVQFECHFPFILHLYREEQLRIYLQRRRQEEWLVWHLDATGSIIRSNVGETRIFNYVVVMAGATPGEPPFPVAEMLSSSHTKVTVEHFLNSIVHQLQKISTGRVIPSVVETDFSWALIQAVLQSVNHQDIVMYLRLAWKVLTSKKPWPAGVTKVHICCAHFMHLMSRNLKRVCSDKGLRQYTLHCTGLLVMSKTLSSASSILKDVYLVLGENLMTKSVSDAHRRLADRMKSPVQETTLEDITDEVSFSSEAFDEEEPRIRGLTISEQSPFTTHFDGLLPGEHDDEGTPNEYFNLDCLQTVKRQLHLFPLWSGCLLTEGISRQSNSPVENHFKILKKDILRGRKRLTPTDYIVQWLPTLNGKIKEASLATDSKIRQKRSPKKRKKDIELSEEKWASPKKKKKAKYFVPPKVVPSPKGTNKSDKV